MCLPTPWQYIILGCTVGGLLLAMLSLLAYQIHLHRGETALPPPVARRCGTTAWHWAA